MRHPSLRLETLEAREVAAVAAGFTESTFAAGLTQPTSMTVSPDGRIFVTEKGGTLRVVQNGNVLATPFVTVGVNTVSERGLLGVALDPNFATNGFVYVYYTTNEATPVNRVSRFASNPADPNVALAAEQILINNIPSTNGNHNGGTLQFAPDGTLFVGVGEAGVPSNAPDLGTLAGKILRINPDGTIPTNNPFVTTTGARPEIWAFGLRNPFTMAFQPGTGRLFINDVGQNTFEEIDEGVAGANYGWPATEGPNPPGVAGVTYPIYSYSHGTGPLQGNSIAGGAFYNPATASFPAEFVGDYFFGDFVNSRIFVRDNATGSVSELSSQTAGAGVVDIDVLPDGRLLYLSLIGGSINQIAADSSTSPPITPPTTPAAPTRLTAVGSGAGFAPAVAAFNPDGSLRFATVLPGFAGVRVATGDVNGDSFEDVVATSGPGGPPVVAVFDGRSGQFSNAFFSPVPGLAPGLNIAAGDLTGDGRAEIVIGTATAAPLVVVLDGTTGQVQRAFVAFAGYAGGVTVAVGDTDGDGRGDIIAGTAQGVSGVAVFSGTDGRRLTQFFGLGAAPIGVNVGYANGDIVVGTAGGPPVVALYTATGQLRYALAPAAVLGGARVTGNGDEVAVGIGPALLTYDRATGALLRARLAFDGLSLGNVFVG